MAKSYIQFLSIYITNVCGLSCDNCASYNNYILKGHYDWAESANKINEWGKLLDVQQVVILGGEPFLHPDLDSWVNGVRAAFPHVTDIRVVTGLKGAQLLKYKEKILGWLDINVTTHVSVHDPEWWNEAIETAEHILKDIEVTKVYNDGIGDIALEKVEYISNNRLTFSIVEQWNFVQSTTKEIRNGIFYLHRNDAEQAHKACYFKDCRYIVHGDLYKCVVTGMADMLVKQIPADEESKKLLEQVVGLDPFVDGFKDLTNTIPQCSLCTVNTIDTIPTWPIKFKKPKVNQL